MGTNRHVLFNWVVYYPFSCLLSWNAWMAGTHVYLCHHQSAAPRMVPGIWWKFQKYKNFKWIFWNYLCIGLVPAQWTQGWINSDSALEELIDPWRDTEDQGLICSLSTWASPMVELDPQWKDTTQANSTMWVLVGWQGKEARNNHLPIVGNLPN